jgi:hypothetical protein
VAVVTAPGLPDGALAGVAATCVAPGVTAPETTRVDTLPDGKIAATMYLCGRPEDVAV